MAMIGCSEELRKLYDEETTGQEKARERTVSRIAELLRGICRERNDITGMCLEKDADCDRCIAEYLVDQGVILPAKVGDTVWQCTEANLFCSKVKNVIYDTNSVAFDDSAIGTSIFLSKYDAELEQKRKIKKNEAAERIPVNINDSVWTTENGKLREGIVRRIELTPNGTDYAIEYGIPGSLYCFTDEDLGKIVFRTQKEAQAEMIRLQGVGGEG